MSSGACCGHGQQSLSLSHIFDFETCQSWFLKSGEKADQWSAMGEVPDMYMSMVSRKYGHKEARFRIENGGKNHRHIKKSKVQPDPPPTLPGDRGGGCGRVFD